MILKNELLFLQKDSKLEVHKHEIDLEIKYEKNEGKKC